MHKLDRTSVPAPSCLTGVTADDRYAQLRGHETAEIRSALLQMQRNRCAYCERRTGIGPKEGHIEHFRKQADNRALELDWSNMFWSCIDEKTCGKHKDNCNMQHSLGPQAAFDPDILIDPSVDDPELFLLFLDDGTVRPRSGLIEADSIRATETIRVFQLDASPFLRQSREDAVKPYKSAVNSLLSFGLDVLQRYLAEVQLQIDDAPFCTVIRQYVKGLTP